MHPGGQGMRTLLLAAAGAFALSAPASAADMPTKAPPLAQATAPCSGFIGAWGEYGRIKEDTGDKEHSGGWGAEGRLNCWINPAWSWQLDGEHDQLVHHGDVAGAGNAPAARRSDLIVGHFNWRDPQVGTAGIFGGWVYPNDIDDGRRVSSALIGVEGQRYFGMFTLYGQAGYLGFHKVSAATFPDTASNFVFGRF